MSEYVIALLACAVWVVSVWVVRRGTAWESRDLTGMGGGDDTGPDDDTVRLMDWVKVGDMVGRVVRIEVCEGWGNGLRERCWVTVETEDGSILRVQRSVVVRVSRG